jgi:hypothetical protein
MGLFGAYFDESGTHRGAEVLVVAGYVAPADQFKKLEFAWWHALVNAGLNPTKEHFHMSHFEARNERYMEGKTPFYGWSDKKANALLSSLVGIMEKRITFGVAIAVDVSDYERWRQHHGPGVDMDQYAFAATRCLHRTAGTMNELKLAGDIAYIFGDGVEGADQVNRAVAGMLASPEWRKEYRVASPGFGGVLKYLALQAADIGVWETRRYCLGARNRDNKGMRESLQRLIARIQHYTEFYHRGALDDFAREFARHIASEPIATDDGDAWPGVAGPVI